MEVAGDYWHYISPGWLMKKELDMLQSISRLFYDMAAWGRLMAACRPPRVERRQYRNFRAAWLWGTFRHPDHIIEYIPEPKESREAA